MSRMFAKGHRFFAVPQALIHIAAELSAKQLWLLLWLHSEAQRRSSNELRYTNKDVAAALQAHHTNVGQMRSALVDAGLLQLQKADRDRFTYVLLDPETGSPIDQPAIPGEEGNWNKVPTVSPQAAAAETTAAPETVLEKSAPIASLTELSTEALKSQYKSLSEKTPEEVEVNAQIRQCRKDPQRTEDLKARRAALEGVRRQKKDSIRLELTARGEFQTQVEADIGLQTNAIGL